MRNPFKKKLDAYQKGELSEEEEREIEADLDKLESYQEYFQAEMEEERDSSTSKKWVKRGIWKARFQNAWTALSLLILLMLVLWFGNALFYLSGSPSKQQQYIDTIKATVSTTMPNMELRSTHGNSGYTRLEIEGELTKRVGHESKDFGNVSASFLLGNATVETPDNLQDEPFFVYPEHKSIYEQKDGVDRLTNLPEGTVSEVYVSFDTYFSTKEIMDKMEKMNNADPVWFAVDTGVDVHNPENGPGDPLGFPYYGGVMEFHDYDEPWKDFESTNERSYSMGGSEDAEMRNEQFIKMLELMNSHFSLARDVNVWLKEDKLEEDIAYVKENGVRIYGMVVTGPTKELLSLTEEEWIHSIAVGEVELWNW
ncbi:anti sigma factor C-terminal domain-containing protein [Pontibacillus salicampi]|uniref:Anti sigma factor C-terminal domain-containing protein n=1 Tax=Pontibacillus salicampi TaxID=1449801 RepID=A0ABV6LK83_9BACI